jgi:hypothetical protein
VSDSVSLHLRAKHSERKLREIGLPSGLVLIQIMDFGSLFLAILPCAGYLGNILNEQLRT